MFCGACVVYTLAATHASPNAVRTPPSKALRHAKHETKKASFHLPGLAEKHDMLKISNPLPRDARIVFDEAKHEYWIDGIHKAPRSVTGLVHAYGWDFDAGAAVTAMKSSARWPDKREAFMTDAGDEMADDAIVEMWKRRGNIASARGTLLHWHAEMHLNGRRMELPHSPEFNMFLEILAVLQQHLRLVPFRTEVLCVLLLGVHVCVEGACTKRETGVPISLRSTTCGTGRRAFPRRRWGDRDSRLEAHRVDQIRQSFSKPQRTSRAPPRFQRLAIQLTAQHLSLRSGNRI